MVQDLWFKILDSKFKIAIRMILRAQRCCPLRDNGGLVFDGEAKWGVPAD